MSNDETKKRWVVREWLSGAREREEYEKVLNQLNSEGYDIYEVDYNRRWITGYLDDSEEVLQQAKEKLGVPVPAGALAAALLERLAAARTQAESEQEDEDEDEGARELREYTVQGVQTNLLLTGLNSVMIAIRLGDPTSEQRISMLVNELFSSLPPEEARRSLKDIEFFHDHHQRHRCDEVDCPSHRAFEAVVGRLRARLATSTAN